MSARLSTLKRQTVQRRLLQRAPRLWAMSRTRTLETGAATVVIVNWNGAIFLPFVLRTVLARSPATTRVIVVDNGSSDGSQRCAETSDHRVKVVRLPVNVGHGTAMDLGFYKVRTEFAVSLDLDAFPLRDDWLDVLTAPLHGGVEVSGAHLRGGFVHPCCLAIRTRRFLDRDHSFVPKYVGRMARDVFDDTADGWDAGHRISLDEPERHLFEVTSRRGPGDVGTVFGDQLVYHNFYSVRHARETANPQTAVLDGEVAQQQAHDAWHEATQRYAGRPHGEASGL